VRAHVRMCLRFLGTQTAGMALPLILNKYMGLFVAMAFFPVMAFTIPFLVYGICSL
jgi:hypothetical protein